MSTGGDAKTGFKEGALFTLNILLELFFNLLKLAVVVIIFLVVYYIVTYAYPRLGWLGHTESGFEDYMVKYYTDFASIITSITTTESAIDSTLSNKESNSSNSTNASNASNSTNSTNATTIPSNQLVSACTDFLNIYKTTFGQDLSDPSTDFSINGSLHLHLLFMYYKELDKQNRKGLGHAYDVLKGQLLPESTKMLQDMYEGPPYINVNDDTWNNFTALKNALDKIKFASVDHDIVALFDTVKKVDVMVLGLMMNNYFDGSKLSLPSHDHVQRMYDLRKGGGFANFHFVGIYVGDYWDYVFKQKIPIDIWGNFKNDMSTLADTVLNYITSDAVLNWFLTLPSKIAGTSNESFVNQHPEVSKKFEDFKETFITPSPYSKDVREPFVGQLIKIATTFIAMFQVITSIINIISDPVAFIKFLIGTIVAILLYIVYFVLVNIQIAVAIAYIYVITLNVFETVFWAVMVLVFAVFYALLSIIDLPLGGFIMRSLRCENLPDAWTNTSNWHNGNMFQRTFFCSWKCGKGFAPSALYPVCLRQNKDEPIYAPHQVIYNTYMNSEYLTSTTDKLFYSHAPDYKYFTIMTDDQKAKLWSDVYQARNDYNASCILGKSGVSTGYVDYDPLIREMCNYYGDASSTIDPTTREKMMELCQTMYCDTNTGSSNPSYCTSASSKADVLSGITEQKDLVKIIIVSSIIILVLGIAMTFLLKSSSDDHYAVMRTNVKAIPGKIVAGVKDLATKVIQVPQEITSRNASFKQ